MGYYISTSVTNIDDIYSAIGSKDRQLLERVKQNESYLQYNKNDDKFYQDLPLAKALEDIIFGTINPNVKAKHSYGYAFICLCKTLGQKPPYQAEIKLWVDTPFINEVVAKFGIQFDIENFFFLGALSLKDFNIPVPNDFPIISILKIAKIQVLADRLNQFTISQEQIEEWEDSDDEDGEEWAWASEHINGIKENLAFCLENNANLCIFCH